MIKRTRASILQNFDPEVAEQIAKSRAIPLMDGLRLFLNSETHEMLVDDSLKLWYFSPLVLYDMWEMRLRPAIRGIRFIYGVMKLDKEFRFFTYLLESYAAYKNTTAGAVLRTLDEKKTD